MTDASTSPVDEHDVVLLLKDQHVHIRALFTAVEEAAPERRPERFEELRRFLAVHETAEEVVVHPRIRATDRGEGVADARLREEEEAKRLLAELDGADPTEPTFADRLGALKKAVLDHADSEEREEFPLLRQYADEASWRRMADAVRVVESVAPTHPHPGAESLTANLLAGPLASLVDRTRDAVRAVMSDR